MWHFHSSCKGTLNHPGMLLNNMCTVMGWFSFCTVGCEVDNLKFFIWNEFTLFTTTNHKLCIIQTTTSSIYFFWDNWNVLLSCVLSLSSLSYCAWSLSSDHLIFFCLSLFFYQASDSYWRISCTSLYSVDRRVLSSVV